MDILFVAHCPPYPPRIEERGLVYHLAREFSHRRHLVDLVAFYDEPEQYADVPRYAHFFREVKLVPAVKKTPSQLQQRLKKVQFPTRAEEAWSPEMWHSIDDFVSRKPYQMSYIFGGIDVYEYYHLLQHYPSVFVPFTTPSHTLPLKIGAARSRSAKQQLQQTFNLIKPYETWMYRPFSQVVVSTEADAKALTKADSEVSERVIPIGVDTDYFTPTGYAPPIPALLFIGDFANKYDLEAAFKLCKQIYPQIQRTHPNLEIYIVGDNPPSELQKLDSEKIHVTGHVLDLRPFFELATVYVSPVVKQIGINTHLLQSLAMMTPTVATPQSCEGLNLATEQQLLVGKSIDEIVRNIQRLLQSQQLYQRLQLGGRDAINQHYSWQRIADQYQALQLELV